MTSTMMLNSWYENLDEESAIIFMVDQIISLELFWPLPLIMVGMLGILNPIIVGGAILLALLPWVARLMAFGHPSRPAFLTFPMLLLIGSGFFGVWASFRPTLSWPFMLMLLGSINLFFAVVNATLPARWLISGVVTISTTVALYFIFQFGHFDYPGETGRLYELGKITGSFLPNLVFFTPHVNAMAAFLSGSFLLSIVLTWQTYQDDDIPWWGITIFILGYALLITNSRGAWLGLIAVGSLWVLLAIPHKNIRYISLAVVGLMISLVVAFVLISFIFPNSLNSLQNTAISRLTLYRNNMYLLGDYPLTGVGLGGTFTLAYSRYQLMIDVPFFDYSHNMFLSVALGQGVFGVIFFMWLIISFYYVVFQVEQVGLSPRPLNLFRAAWLSVTATMIHGLTDAPQFSGSGWTLPMFFVLIGLAISVGRPALLWMADDSDPNKTVTPARWPKYTFALFMVLLIGGGLLYQQSLRALWYSNLGAVYQTQAELNPDLDEATQALLSAQAVAWYNQALDIKPEQTVANRRLGMMALDQLDFPTAITYLETAYPHETSNQATIQALGLAYLWHGELDKAEVLLRRVDGIKVEDFNYKIEKWKKRGHPDLAEYGLAIQERLKDITEK